MIRNFQPTWIMFFDIFICDIIKVSYCFIILSRLIFSFLHISSLHVPCAYVSIKSIDCILLSSFELKAILLITSVKTLCHSLLNLCCAFNFFSFYKFFLISFKTAYINSYLFFLNNLFSL